MARRLSNKWRDARSNEPVAYGDDQVGDMTSRNGQARSVPAPGHAHAPALVGASPYLDAVLPLPPTPVTQPMSWSPDPRRDRDVVYAFADALDRVPRYGL